MRVLHLSLTHAHLVLPPELCLASGCLVCWLALPVQFWFVWCLCRHIWWRQSMATEGKHVEAKDNAKETPSPEPAKNTSKRTRLGGPAGASCLRADQQRGGRGGRCRGIGRPRACGNVSASQTAASLMCVSHVTNRRGGCFDFWIAFWILLCGHSGEDGEDGRGAIAVQFALSEGERGWAGCVNW